jgi:3-deoxy-D-arabino-heptulosonate 7-phosphate (DAHP) synthase
MPITEKASSTVYQARVEIADILHGKDDRLLVVVGPSSIHDTKGALEYAAPTQDSNRRAVGGPAGRNACLFREAPHNHWLEGVD